MLNGPFLKLHFGELFRKRLGVRCEGGGPAVLSQVLLKRRDLVEHPPRDRRILSQNILTLPDVAFEIVKSGRVATFDVQLPISGANGL